MRTCLRQETRVVAVIAVIAAAGLGGPRMRFAFLLRRLGRLFAGHGFLRLFQRFGGFRRCRRAVQAGFGCRRRRTGRRPREFGHACSIVALAACEPFHGLFRKQDREVAGFGLQDAFAAGGEVWQIDYFDCFRFVSCLSCLELICYAGSNDKGSQARCASDASRRRDRFGIWYRIRTRDEGSMQSLRGLGEP